MFSIRPVQPLPVKRVGPELTRGQWGGAIHKRVVRLQSGERQVEVASDGLQTERQGNMRDAEREGHLYCPSSDEANRMMSRHHFDNGVSVAPPQGDLAVVATYGEAHNKRDASHTSLLHSVALEVSLLQATWTVPCWTHSTRVPIHGRVSGGPTKGLCGHTHRTAINARANHKALREGEGDAHSVSPATA